MGVFAGPDVSESGLVLALDAGNSKGFDDDENLALNSEAINSWANNGNAISISANSQIAPNGTLTADVLSQTAVTGASRWVSSMTRTYTAGVTYTLSIWLKKISGTDAQPTINLWVNGGTNQSVGAITTEWVRYSKSFTPASTISSSTFTGLNTGWSDTGVANNFTFAAWGFQVEVGSTATDYYRTTGTAKNRGTTLIDLSGRGNTGTLTNGPTYSSANGGSIVFDGTNDRISVTFNSAFNLVTSTTINIWYFAVGGGFIMNKNKGGWEGYNIGPGSIDYSGQSGSNDFSRNWSYSSNRWNMFTWVVNRESGVYLIYLNGVQQGTSGTITHPALTSTNPLHLGSRGDVPDNFFNGRISNTTIYNRALTAAEISQNFNATRSRYGI